MSNYVKIGTLLTNIKAYTNFMFGGYQIQLPYYWGGKESASTIRSRLVNLCNGDGSNMTEGQIQSIASNNSSQCGIDCSGFALRTANESTNNGNVILNYFSGIAYNIDNNFPVNASVETRYRWGIGALTLTNANYSRKITDILGIKTGDFIRFDKGDHIGIVTNITSGAIQGSIRYVIEYAHSSGDKGPHEAYIAFTVTSLNALSQLSLTDGYWFDWSTSYSNTIKSLYNYVCRPNCLD